MGEITPTGAEQLTNKAGDVYVRTHWAYEPFDVASLSAYRLGFHAKAYAPAAESGRKHGSVTIFGVVSIERQDPKHDGDPIELVIETKAGTVRIDLFGATDRPVELKGEA